MITRRSKKDELFGTDWTFPLRPNARGDIATVSGVDNLYQALMDIVEVAVGETIYNEGYGADAMSVLHDSDSEAAGSAIMELANRVVEQVMKHEARIKTIKSEPVKTEDGWALKHTFTTMYYGHEHNYVTPLRYVK